jgi:FKBP-type peptidyl-prolyl cis-trans isomerase FklB
MIFNIQEEDHRMKHVMIAVLSVGIFFGSCFAGETIDLKDEKVKVSYSIGYQVGGDFKRQNYDINPEILLRGVQDALKGNKPLMSNDEMQAALIDLQQQVTAAQEQEMKAKSEKNLSEGRAFLAENKKKEGVKTTPSGLQYTIIKEGTGAAMVQATDTVTVHYRGTLIDGSEFDSSYRRGKPATFPVSGVIAGWTEALQLMKEGDTWQLFIPPELAYGEKGVGKIGPNSTLIFDVELLSVQNSNAEEAK